RDHGQWLEPVRAQDGRTALEQGFDAVIDGPADILMVSGATSVGLEDLMPTVLASRGKLLIHGVAMRPASPTGLGQLADGRFVFLLPGNPVSCLCAYEFFVGPLVRTLGGLATPGAWPHPRRRLPLARKIVSKIGRVDFVRVGLQTQPDGTQAVIPIATSGASNLSSAVRADGIVLVPRDLEGIAPGATVEVYLFEQPPRGEASP
ncbi:MAG: molybdopterin-binding protein, partial [Nannocystaceae bacterium]